MWGKYESTDGGRVPRLDINVGDIVIFAEVNARYFDLVKDTMLVKSYCIVAVEKSASTEKEQEQQGHD